MKLNILMCYFIVSILIICLFPCCNNELKEKSKDIDIRKITDREQGKTFEQKDNIIKLYEEKKLKEYFMRIKNSDELIEFTEGLKLIDPIGLKCAILERILFFTRYDRDKHFNIIEIDNFTNKNIQTENDLSLLAGRAVWVYEEVTADSLPAITKDTDMKKFAAPMTNAVSKLNNLVHDDGMKKAEDILKGLTLEQKRKMAKDRTITPYTFFILESLAHEEDKTIKKNLLGNPLSCIGVIGILSKDSDPEISAQTMEILEKAIPIMPFELIDGKAYWPDEAREIRENSEKNHDKMPSAKE